MSPSSLNLCHQVGKNICLILKEKKSNRNRFHFQSTAKTHLTNAWPFANHSWGWHEDLSSWVDITIGILFFILGGWQGEFLVEVVTIWRLALNYWIMLCGNRVDGKNMLCCQIAILTRANTSNSEILRQVQVFLPIHAHTHSK